MFLAVATQKQDTLHTSLKQLPRCVDQLSDSAWPSQYSLPQPGTRQFEKAHQSHALTMGEAKASCRWWAPLKKAAAAADRQMLDGWEQQEAAWRSNWGRIHSEA